VLVLRDNYRVSRRLQDVHAQRRVLELIGHPRRTFEHVLLVLRLGADTGNGEELLEQLE
jgi:hypothetical protein